MTPDPYAALIDAAAVLTAMANRYEKDNGKGERTDGIKWLRTRAEWYRASAAQCNGRDDPAQAQPGVVR